MSDTANCCHKQLVGQREFCPDCGLSRTEVLVEACAPFLKDDETPAECIRRNRKDVDGCLTMLIDEKRKNDALAARLAEVQDKLSIALAANHDLRDERDSLKDRLADPCRTYDKDGKLLTVCHNLAGTEARLAEAERDALRTAIEQHNFALQDLCGFGDKEAVACKYRDYFVRSGRRCPNCPTEWMIALPEDAALAKSEQ